MQKLMRLLISCNAPDQKSYAWPVSPGQVAAVPVPGAAWLMGTGLMGLLGLKRREHAK